MKTRARLAAVSKLNQEGKAEVPVSYPLVTVAPRLLGSTIDGRVYVVTTLFWGLWVKITEAKSGAELISPIRVNASVVY